MFTLTIQTSSAAFHTEGEDREEVFAPEVEVQRILREVAERVEHDTWAGSVFDINGHNVGSFELAQEDTEVAAGSDLLAMLVSTRPCLDAETTDADLAEWVRTAIIPAMEKRGVM